VHVVENASQIGYRQVENLDGCSLAMALPLPYVLVRLEGRSGWVGLKRIQRRQVIGRLELPVVQQISTLQTLEVFPCLRGVGVLVVRCARAADEKVVGHLVAKPDEDNGANLLRILPTPAKGGDSLVAPLWLDLAKGVILGDGTWIFW
jgi:hypothetical protein